MIEPAFIHQLSAEPWAILPGSFVELIRQIQTMEAGQRADDLVGARFSNGQPIYPQVEMVGPVAIVPVHGAMGRHCSVWQHYFGMSDSAILQEQLRNVRDDQDAEIVVIDFRTPGGLALGLEETAATIREVSEGGKAVIAYVDSLCASAGYFLAAACDAIYADPAARVGSISTVMMGVDSSKAWEQAGVELKLFSSGALKTIGLSGKEWTEEEEAHMKERLEFYDGHFKGFVRSRRPVSEDHMQGQIWQAKEVEGLLVDGFANTLPELVAALVS